MSDETSKIQLFVPTFRIDETLSEIRACLERGWTGLGFKTDEFEDEWKKYTGLPHAHFLNSATSGLHLAVELLRERGGWEDGDEVITTALTFVSTNHAILYARLRPVFADVDESLNLSPASVAARIGPRTRAVMFVGMGGNAANLDEITKLCRERGLALILDAAHMAGTRVDGVHVGHGVDVAVYSFQAVKNLPTADSGMICFADRALDEKARKRSWLGISKTTAQRTSQAGTYRWEYDVEAVGYKYHGNSVMAAMGLVALRYLDQDNAYRRQLASWYDEAFDQQPDVKPVAHERGSARHLYQVVTDERDALMVHLNAHGIYPGVHYRDSCSYRMYMDQENAIPFTRNVSGRLVTLPMHMRLTYADAQRVAGAVLSFRRHQRTVGR